MSVRPHSADEQPSPSHQPTAPQTNTGVDDIEVNIASELNDNNIIFKALNTSTETTLPHNPNQASTSQYNNEPNLPSEQLNKAQINTQSSPLPLDNSSNKLELPNISQNHPTSISHHSQSSQSQQSSQSKNALRRNGASSSSLATLEETFLIQQSPLLGAIEQSYLLQTPSTHQQQQQQQQQRDKGVIIESANRPDKPFSPQYDNSATVQSSGQTTSTFDLNGQRSPPIGPNYGTKNQVLNSTTVVTLPRIDTNLPQKDNPISTVPIEHQAMGVGEYHQHVGPQNHHHHHHQRSNTIELNHDGDMIQLHQPIHNVNAISTVGSLQQPRSTPVSNEDNEQNLNSENLNNFGSSEKNDNNNIDLVGSIAPIHTNSSHQQQHIQHKLTQFSTPQPQNMLLHVPFGSSLTPDLDINDHDHHQNERHREIYNKQQQQHHIQIAQSQQQQQYQQQAYTSRSIQQQGPYFAPSGPGGVTNNALTPQHSQNQGFNFGTVQHNNQNEQYSKQQNHSKQPHLATNTRVGATMTPNPPSGIRRLHERGDTNEDNDHNNNNNNNNNQKMDKNFNQNNNTNLHGKIGALNSPHTNIQSQHNQVSFAPNHTNVTQQYRHGYQNTAELSRSGSQFNSYHNINNLRGNTTTNNNNNNTTATNNNNQNNNNQNNQNNNNTRLNTPAMSIFHPNYAQTVVGSTAMSTWVPYRNDELRKKIDLLFLQLSSQNRYQHHFNPITPDNISHVGELQTIKSSEEGFELMKQHQYNQDQHGMSTTINIHQLPAPQQPQQRTQHGVAMSYIALSHTNTGILGQESVSTGLTRNLHDKNQTVHRDDFITFLSKNGILSDDPRISTTMAQLKKMSLLTSNDFTTLILNDLFLRKIILNQFVITDFQQFGQILESVFQRVKKDQSGHVAEYIPQLASVDPNQFGLGVCTVDGQRYSAGEADKAFCIQSCSKPITYCAILKQHGVRHVHQHIGREPSGRGFNERVLTAEGWAHNPMINAGAIMSVSLFYPNLNEDERFDKLVRLWKKLSGSNHVTFNNSVYLSEKATADRNHALGYMMKESGAFHYDVNLKETLELYFMQCSIELTCNMMSVVAATFANGGVNPLTNKRIFEPSVVRYMLSLMFSAGMYDASGEFAFKVGFPTKSGVSGVIMMVIPGKMGICTWSPRLDSVGNSVRGVSFCHLLLKMFDLHIYSNVEYKPPTPLHFEYMNKLRRYVIHLKEQVDKAKAQTQLYLVNFNNNNNQNNNNNKNQNNQNLITYHPNINHSDPSHPYNSVKISPGRPDTIHSPTHHNTFSLAHLQSLRNEETTAYTQLTNVLNHMSGITSVTPPTLATIQHSLIVAAFLNNVSLYQQSVALLAALDVNKVSNFDAYGFEQFFQDNQTNNDDEQNNNNHNNNNNDPNNNKNTVKTSSDLINDSNGQNNDKNPMSWVNLFSPQSGLNDDTLEFSRSILDTISYDGYKLIEIAAIMGHVEMVHLLLVGGVETAHFDFSRVMQMGLYLEQNRPNLSEIVASATLDDDIESFDNDEVYSIALDHRQSDVQTTNAVKNQPIFSMQNKNKNENIETKSEQIGNKNDIKITPLPPTPVISPTNHTDNVIAPNLSAQVSTVAPLGGDKNQFKVETNLEIDEKDDYDEKNIQVKKITKNVPFDSKTPTPIETTTTNLVQTLTSFSTDTTELLSSCLYHRRVLCCELIKLSKLHQETSPSTLRLHFDSMNPIHRPESHIEVNTSLVSDLGPNNGIEDDNHETDNDNDIFKSQNQLNNKSQLDLRHDFWTQFKATVEASTRKNQNGLNRGQKSHVKHYGNFPFNSTTLQSALPHTTTSLPNNHHKIGEKRPHTGQNISDVVVFASSGLRPSTNIVIKPQSYRTKMAISNIIPPQTDDNHNNQRGRYQNISNFTKNGTDIQSLADLTNNELEKFISSIEIDKNNHTKWIFNAKPPTWLVPLIASFDGEGLFSVDAVRLCQRVVSLGYPAHMCKVIIDAVDHFVLKENLSCHMVQNNDGLKENNKNNDKNSSIHKADFCSQAQSNNNNINNNNNNNNKSQNKIKSSNNTHIITVDNDMTFELSVHGGGMDDIDGDYDGHFIDSINHDDDHHEHSNHDDNQVTNEQDHHNIYTTTSPSTQNSTLQQFHSLESHNNNNNKNDNNHNTVKNPKPMATDTANNTVTNPNQDDKGNGNGNGDVGMELTITTTRSCLCHTFTALLSERKYAPIALSQPFLQAWDSHVCNGCRNHRPVYQKGDIITPLSGTVSDEEKDNDKIDQNDNKLTQNDIIINNSDFNNAVASVANGNSAGMTIIPSNQPQNSPFLPSNQNSLTSRSYTTTATTCSIDNIDGKSRSQRVFNEIQSLALNLFPFHTQYRIIPAPKTHPVFDYTTPDIINNNDRMGNKIQGNNSSKTSSRLNNVIHMLPSQAQSHSTPILPTSNTQHNLVMNAGKDVALGRTITSVGKPLLLSQEQQQDQSPQENQPHSVIYARISYVNFARLLMQLPLLFLICTKLVAVPNWKTFVQNINYIGLIVAEEEKRALRYLQVSFYYGVELDEIHRYLEDNQIDIDSLFEDNVMIDRHSKTNINSFNDAATTTYSHAKIGYHDDKNKIFSPIHEGGQYSGQNDIDKYGLNNITSKNHNKPIPIASNNNFKSPFKVKTHYSQNIDQIGYNNDMNNPMDDSINNNIPFEHQNFTSNLIPTIDNCSSHDDVFNLSYLTSVDTNKNTSDLLHNHFITNFSDSDRAHSSTSSSTHHPSHNGHHHHHHHHHHHQHHRNNSSSSLYESVHLSQQSHQQSHRSDLYQNRLGLHANIVNANQFLTLSPSFINHLYIDCFTGNTARPITELDPETHTSIFFNPFSWRNEVLKEEMGYGSESDPAHFFRKTPLSSHIATATYAFDTNDYHDHDNECNSKKDDKYYKIKKSTKSDRKDTKDKKSQKRTKKYYTSSSSETSSSDSECDLQYHPSQSSQGHWFPVTSPGRPGVKKQQKEKKRNKTGNITKSRSLRILNRPQLTYDYEACTSLILEPKLRNKAKICPNSLRAFREHEKIVQKHKLDRKLAKRLNNSSNQVSGDEIDSVKSEEGSGHGGEHGGGVKKVKKTLANRRLAQLLISPLESRHEDALMMGSGTHNGNVGGIMNMIGVNGGSGMPRQPIYSLFPTPTVPKITTNANNMMNKQSNIGYSVGSSLNGMGSPTLQGSIGQNPNHALFSLLPTNNLNQMQSFQTNSPNTPGVVNPLHVNTNQLGGAFGNVQSFLTPQVQQMKQIASIQSQNSHISQLGQLPTNNTITVMNNFTDKTATTASSTTTSTMTQTHQPKLPSIPSQFGLSLCTTTGQTNSFGANPEDSFCVQSLFKVINYCIVQELFGEEEVHRYVGREPSGRDMGDLSLDHHNLPHNPYINSGAISLCALLLLPHLTMSQCFDLILSYVRRLTAYQGHVTYNIPHYLNEKEESDRNYCLAFMIKDSGKFPTHIRTHRDVDSILELYALCSSIELTRAQVSIIAATLSNGGINPLNNDVIFSPRTVRNALSMMSTCGVYNFAGEFSFHVGLPAKSSADGMLMVCIPTLMGLCVSSPILDENGLSILSCRFMFRLSKYYSLHIYDSYDMTRTNKKNNPRDCQWLYSKQVIELLCAAKKNDTFTIQKLVKLCINLNVFDGFGRTALHLAVQNGSIGAVELLLREGALVMVTDINGKTPHHYGIIAQNNNNNINNNNNNSLINNKNNNTNDNNVNNNINNNNNTTIDTANTTSNVTRSNSPLKNQQQQQQEQYQQSLQQQQQHQHLYHKHQSFEGNAIGNVKPLVMKMATVNEFNHQNNKENSPMHNYDNNNNNNNNNRNNNNCTDYLYTASNDDDDDNTVNIDVNNHIINKSMTHLEPFHLPSQQLQHQQQQHQQQQTPPQHRHSTTTAQLILPLALPTSIPPLPMLSSNNTGNNPTTNRSTTHKNYTIHTVTNNHSNNTDNNHHNTTMTVDSLSNSLLDNTSILTTNNSHETNNSGHNHTNSNNRHIRGDHYNGNNNDADARVQACLELINNTKR